MRPESKGRGIPPVNVQRFGDVGAFAARVEPFLLAHEAEHCLQIGILATLPQQPNAWGEDPPYLALVEHDGEIVLVAIRTPPHNIIVSLASEQIDVAQAMARLVDDLRTVYGDTLPGVIGPTTESRELAMRWQRETGQAYRVAFKERIYRLDAVVPVAEVPGTMRPATAADRDLLVRWIAAFTDEAGPEPVDAETWADRALIADPALRGTYLWEDGGAPVSLVAYGGPTPHGMRIGPVYTPPERRGHGYASACTAAVSQMLLDGGRRFCCLFTDLANPTSNKIYQAIGYRPVIDVNMYHFTAG